MRASVLVLLVVSLAGPVAAQEAVPGPDREPTESEVAEARALYMAGQAAVESGRWDDAVGSFRRAYQLSGVGAALFNVAFAMRALGRHREARDAFDQFLRDHPETDEELAADARRYRTEAANRIAALIVTGLDPTIRYRIGFDGERLEDPGDRPLRFETDEGSHSLSIRTPDLQPFLWEGMLEEAQQLTIEAVLRPIPRGGVSPWVWVGLGIGLAVVGGIVAYVLLRDIRELSPNSDMVVRL